MSSKTSLKDSSREIMAGECGRDAVPGFVVLFLFMDAIINIP
jgi:hypothetical protein